MEAAHLRVMRDALTSGACFNAGGLWKPDVESGTYDINPGGGSTTFKVHCDFDSPEGPWMVIMARRWDDRSSVSFEETFSNYENGFPTN